MRMDFAIVVRERNDTSLRLADSDIASLRRARSSLLANHAGCKVVGAVQPVIKYKARSVPGGAIDDDHFNRAQSHQGIEGREKACESNGAVASGDDNGNVDRPRSHADRPTSIAAFGAVFPSAQ